MKSANPIKQAPKLQHIHDEVIIQSLRDRIAPYPSILTSQTVGERSNFKTFLTHTQDHGDDIATRGEYDLRTLVDRNEALTQHRGSSRTSSSRSDRSKHRYSGTSEFFSTRTAR